MKLFQNTALFVPATFLAM